MAPARGMVDAVLQGALGVREGLGGAAERHARADAVAAASVPGGTPGPHRRHHARRLVAQRQRLPHRDVPVPVVPVVVQVRAAEARRPAPRPAPRRRPGARAPFVSAVSFVRGGGFNPGRRTWTEERGRDGDRGRNFSGGGSMITGAISAVKLTTFRSRAPWRTDARTSATDILG